jgi:hypothetical protein
VQLDGLVKVFKDGRLWEIGTSRKVDWIVNGTTDGQSITVAIPPVFEAYASFYEPDAITTVAHEHAVVDRLVAFTRNQFWWLGYLDTGAHDVVFPDAPRVSLYWDWHYVWSPPGRIRPSRGVPATSERTTAYFQTCSFLKTDPG